MYRRMGSSLVIIVVLLTGISGGVAAPKAGTLLAISGDAKIRRDGHDVTIQPGMSILGGDLIKTGATGKVSIELLGEHIISIGRNSEFEIDEPGAEREDLNSAMLYMGSVYIKKRPSGNKTPYQLQIQTPGAVAGIRGTAVGVAVAPDGSARIGVEEGNVEVETERNKKVTLGIREGVTIDPSGKAPLKVSEYLPERDDLESWANLRKEAVLKYPLPAAARLTLNLTASVALGERIAREVAASTEKVISEAQAAEQERVRGKTAAYLEHSKKVVEMMPALIVRIRALVRLDNMIQSRGAILEWLVREVTAPGSPSPKRAITVLQKHYDDFNSLKARTDKLHEDRVKLLRERVPVMRELVRYIKQ